MRVLQRITHQYQHINSDDFGGHLALRYRGPRKEYKDQGQACNWFGDCEDRLPSILKDGITYVKYRKIISNILITSSLGPMGIVVIVISGSDNDKLSSPFNFFYLEIRGK